jgi:hypothetical protein
MLVLTRLFVVRWFFFESYLAESLFFSSLGGSFSNLTSQNPSSFRRWVVPFRILPGKIPLLFVICGFLFESKDIRPASGQFSWCFDCGTGGGLPLQCPPNETDGDELEIWV